MQLLREKRPAGLRRAGGNGGFPDPPAGEPVRVVRRAHGACGGATRIRLPAALPPDVVRRVVCDRCRQVYEPSAEDARAQPPAPPAATTAAVFAEAASRAPSWAQGRLWAWISLPIAFVAVLLGLSLIQGDDATSPDPQGTGAASAGSAGAARFIDRPGYSLALPAGWSKIDPPDGAVFAARSEDGAADVTLWIEEEPDLSMREFEERSLEQLGEIGENPRVINRVEAPTLEGTIVELRADTPIADGVTAPYRVTLRGAGPFRHYLASSQRPGSEPRIAADIELLHSSLRPDVELGDPGSG